MYAGRITSLEEDFRQLGLLTEEDTNTAAVDEMDMGDMSDEMAMGGGMKKRRMRKKKRGMPKKKGMGMGMDMSYEDAEANESDGYLDSLAAALAELDEDEIEEVTQKVHTARGGTKKRRVSAKTLKGELLTDPKHKRARQKARSGQAKAKRRQYWQRKGKKLAKRRRQHSGSDVQADMTDARVPFGRVNQLIDEVKSIVSGMEEDAEQNAVQSFANMALISNMLETAFGTFAEQTGDADFERLSEKCEDLAEASAMVAEALDERRIEPADLEEEFGGMMSDLCDMVEVYTEVTEDEDDLDEVFGENDDTEDDGDVVTRIRQRWGN